MLGGHGPDYVRLVWIVASAFGALALVALVVLYRRAARRYELEQAERIIAEHDRGAE